MIGRTDLGEKLMEYYKKAEAIGGKEAQLKLGLMTCMPLIFAKFTQDSPENLHEFEIALKRIEIENKKNTNPKIND